MLSPSELWNHFEPRKCSDKFFTPKAAHNTCPTDSLNSVFPLYFLDYPYHQIRIVYIPQGHGNKGKTPLEDYCDITDTCGLTIRDGRLKFKVDHFSDYGMISVLVTHGLEIAWVQACQAIKVLVLLCRVKNRSLEIGFFDSFSGRTRP